MLAVLCTLLLCSALLNIYFMRPGADTRGQQQQTKRFSFRGESATNHHLYIWRHIGISNHYYGGPGSVIEEGRSAKFWSKHSVSSKGGEERQKDKGKK